MNDWRDYRGSNRFGMRDERDAWSPRSSRQYGDRDRDRFGGDEGERSFRGNDGGYGGHYGGYRDDEMYGRGHDRFRGDDRDEPGMWDRMKGAVREGWDSMMSDENEGRRGSMMRPSSYDDDRGFGANRYTRGYDRGLGDNRYGGGRYGGLGQPRFGDRQGVSAFGGAYGNYGSYGGRSSGYGGTDYGSRGWMRGDRDDDRSVWERAQESMREGWQDLKETFSGKGPKGYSRSDDRIREDVCDRLTRHPGIDASDLEITVRNGEVTLSGAVSERRMKRLAEDVAEDVDGVTDVTNQVRVARTPTQTATAKDTTRENGLTANVGTTNRTGAQATR